MHTYMAKPASNDVRKRVVMAVLAGQSSRAVAERFNVAPSSPSKWTQHYRDSGSFGPRQMGGHRRALLEPHKTFIMTRVAEMPHVTVRGLERRAGGTRCQGDARYGLAIPAQPQAEP